jgi:hypothetical protein
MVFTTFQAQLQHIQSKLPSQPPPPPNPRPPHQVLVECVCVRAFVVCALPFYVVDVYLGIDMYVPPSWLLICVYAGISIRVGCTCVLVYLCVCDSDCVCVSCVSVCLCVMRGKGQQI